MNFNLLNLTDFLTKYNEDFVKTVLLLFRCQLNSEVEYFLHTQAINFTKQKISITFLMTYVFNDKIEIAGYFSLANKILSVSCKGTSNTLIKKISKFSLVSDDQTTYFTPIPLIAQHGKNAESVYSLSGKDLLSIACNTIANVQKQIGGKYIYVESIDNE